MTRRLALLVLTLAVTAPALAEESACDGGRYLLDEGLPFLDQPAIVVIRGDQVSLHSGFEEVCGAPDKSRVRRRGDRLRVRARWDDCGPEAGKVRLRLRTSRGCATAKGRVRSKQPRSRVRFTATRSCQYTPVVACMPGYRPADADGDGCTETCEPLSGQCDGVPIVDCLPDFAPADLDGDGCTETCEPIPALCPEALCLPGYEPADNNGDGCFESCEVSASACFSDTECAEPASYCARGIGMCDGPGRCSPRTAACTREFRPVCGCDGVTYPNDCVAASAGSNIAFEGACEDSLSACSSDAECTAPGSYCSRPAGLCGGPGTCAPRGEVCPEIFDPVCGCNGVTYSNSCFAGVDGINVASEGPCEEPATTCSSDAECPEAGSYCARAIGMCGGLGTCTPRTLACTRVGQPVCGCDGITYSNPCVAASAGSNLAHDGACAG